MCGVHPSPATAKCYQCDVPIQRPPSQIDYIMTSRRWSTSAHKTRVKLDVSCQRWGRDYDHELVTCDWQCCVMSQCPQQRQIDYSTLERDELTQDRFNASVAQHLEDSPCDLDDVVTSLTRLTKCVTDAARETLPVRHSQPLSLSTPTMLHLLMGTPHWPQPMSLHLPKGP